MRRKSFTLIEILVVITIIGILAGVIFVAGGAARKKAKDNRIINDLYQLQNRAERIYLDEGKYYWVEGVEDARGVCWHGGCDPEILNLKGDINSQGGNTAIFSSAYKYCAYSPLVSSPTMAFCIDSQGKSIKKIKSEVAKLCALLLCPFSKIDCADFNCSGEVDNSDIDRVLDQWYGTDLNDVPNERNFDYDCDSNCNGIPDGQECDMNQNNTIDIGDAIIVNGQKGSKCAAPWCPDSWCPVPLGGTGSCPPPLPCP